MNRGSTNWIPCEHGVYVNVDNVLSLEEIVVRGGKATQVKLIDGSFRLSNKPISDFLPLGGGT